MKDPCPFVTWVDPAGTLTGPYASETDIRVQCERRADHGPGTVPLLPGHDGHVAVTPANTLVSW